MTNNLDDYDYDFFDLDEIRKPDPVKREILVPANLDEDSNFARMLQISKDEFHEKKAQEQYLIDNIKERLQKIKGHDRPNKDIYDELETNIALYELEYIVSFELNLKSYLLIKSIRFSKEESDLLDKLIVKNENK
jgi:hypothetical protein